MQILWIERLLQGNGERKENKSNRNDNRFDLEELVFPELPLVFSQVLEVLFNMRWT